MNYDEIFKQEAFKCINPEVLEKFNVLISNIKGKSTNEAILHIMNFYNCISKEVKISDKEKDTLIQAIILNLPEEDRKKFLNMLDMINNII
ncbi:hypothetical protein [[Clostridium] colinum]|uniref:hypothetical protein n=1 Tax=[Clostridium] colinum TaxID=36835 RepID=UPI0020258738|nr:hypothetical protein [[Clostridium] colinum]